MKETFERGDDLTKNKEIAEMMFNVIREYKFKPYDIQYGNVYFVFNRGDDSVVHFKIHGCRGWKFGMWINSEYLDEENRKDEPKTYGEGYKVVSIFAQYEKDIDKFKPSASTFCVEYEAREWEKHLEYPNPWYKIKEMIGMIKRHPLISYAGHAGSHSGYIYKSFLLYFLKHRSKDVISDIRKVFNKVFHSGWLKLKVLFAKRSKIIESIVIEDFEKENPGWSTGYLYKVKITFNEAATEIEEQKWLNRWFRKDSYGKYGAFNKVVELDPFRKVGFDGMFVYK